MKTLEILNDIANSLSEKAESLRAEGSSEDLSDIICISVESSDKEDAAYRINVDHFGDIDDISLIVLIEKNFIPILGDVEIKHIVSNGRWDQDGYNYYSEIFYI